MLEKTKSYISNNNLFEQTDNLLIAVSGGVDSVVLLHILHSLKYNVNVAHCNFNLRGSESDNDELFVRNLCEKYNINGHFTSFDTINYAKNNSLSIEMAARNLRYNWFNKLCKQFDYSKIATGHHLNDSIETLFLNLTRGTGINGITGISPINKNIARPLLSCTRKDIELFASKNNLDYITDSSNDSLLFLRNIIRHKIIPVFKDINPSFEHTMLNNIEILNDVALIFNNQVKSNIRNISTHTNNETRIEIKKLLSLTPTKTYLFELINPLGFNISNVRDIISAINSSPGKIFYSKTHKILIDRDCLVIKQINNNSNSIIINSISDFNKIPIKITVNERHIDDFKLIKDVKTACIDADKITFPLTLRKWKDGDYFFPLGMNNKQKLSDFFINQKINRFEKDELWILEHNNNIVWIVGIRIDNRYKVTSKTNQVLILQINN